VVADAAKVTLPNQEDAGVMGKGPKTMRRAAVGVLAAVLAVLAPAYAQVGTQLIVTMNLAAPVKATGGSYYLAFTVDDSILTGPQSDSTNWTHYAVYRQGRFFFGRVPPVPPAAFRPFGFEAIRPPDPYPFGEVSPDRRQLRVRIALSDLQTGPSLPLQIKVNLVTVDDLLRPLDALGRGATDRFGFVTLDLRRETYVTITHLVGDALDQSFAITGGSIQVTTP
jgi:hypothetical protein